ncbi:MAG: hypothetical protein FD123_2829 [Bacteroidetes bacterium]|nr:MAG: hypothetical protein FD123_2829 [Bacteroidota bacterium]
MKQLRVLFFSILSFASAIVPGKAQTPVLQRVVNIEISGQRLSDALELVALKGNFHFSYNAALINGDSIVSLKAGGQTVKQVLDQLFKGKITYKERDNYLILTRTPVQPVAARPKKKEHTGYIVSGYITDRETGKRLAYASVYDTASMSSSFSDSAGFFKLPIQKSPQQGQAIAVSKKNYLDTVIFVQPATKEAIEIMLSPGPPPLAIEPDLHYINPEMTFNENYWVRHFTTFRQRLAAMNIRDLTGVRSWQVSFIPGFGTSGALSSTISYRFSFNILGGYTGGVQGAEIGGLFNINRNDVRGMQLGGLFNACGGNVQGVQIGGLVNMNYGKTNAVQIGGLFNLCRDSVQGVQLAGLFNVNKKPMQGVQVAGLGNIQPKRIRGAQLAGLFNVTDTCGVQVAGLINAAKSSGPQVAGLINAAKTVNGAQVSGLVNVAGYVKGAQVSFLNIADSCDGATVGFLSFVRSGVHQLEISTNEAVGINLRFRTGSRQFYNIIAGGFHPVPGQFAFTAGYGVGTQARFGKKAGLTFDASAHEVFLGNDSWQFNQMYRTELSFTYQLHPKVALFAGASFNANLYDTQYTPDPEFAGQIAPLSVYTKNFSSGYRFTMWPGFQAGIRLF